MGKTDTRSTNAVGDHDRADGQLRAYLRQEGWLTIACDETLHPGIGIRQFLPSAAIRQSFSKWKRSGPSDSQETPTGNKSTDHGGRYPGSRWESAGVFGGAG